MKLRIHWYDADGKLLRTDTLVAPKVAVNFQPVQEITVPVTSPAIAIATEDPK